MGRWFAMTGLIIGYLEIVLIIFFTIIILKRFSYEILEHSKLDSLWCGCYEYIDKNDGEIPTNFYNIARYKELTISSISKITNKPSYKIVIKGNINDYPDKSNTIMIAEITPNKRGSYRVIYLDGHQEIIYNKKFQH